MTEIGGRRSEIGGQRSEVGEQRSEVRSQRLGNKGWLIPARMDGWMVDRDRKQGIVCSCVMGDAAM